MADYIQQLQKSKRKPTEREQEILEELVGPETKLTKYKVSIILGFVTLLLSVPVLKNFLKQNIPFFSNEYYYSTFVAAVVTITALIIIQG